ncbi:hypothetical protein [Streptomyces sp. NBC_01216]|uniref:hypothetical protein n=1 Tax=unclassified Streptomyces TaxID=2593676 RepID=UPI002E1324CE|nr:hypothetical protein OG393_05225 [Streptomyces sp. NBC_01216]
MTASPPGGHRADRHLAADSLRTDILLPEPGADGTAHPCAPDTDHLATARQVLDSLPDPDTPSTPGST